jgi:fatty acid desaturase
MSAVAVIENLEDVKGVTNNSGGNFSQNSNQSQNNNQNSRSCRVPWYRTPLDKETMRALNAKSDLKGFAQTLGHLGILLLTGGLALYGVGRWPWWTIAFLIFAHGTVASFAINAVHELVHKSVFKTQALNVFFARVFAFFGWINHEHFWNSHTRHHQYTLHQPDDLEVVLPLKVLTQHFFKFGFINLPALINQPKNTLRLARGRFAGQWESTLFPDDKPEVARPVIAWARFLLVGHVLIFAASLLAGALVDARWFLLPVLTSLTPAYGLWLHFLCNNTQHIGLQDGVPDFRLSCRTFTVNPIVQFLYWHMNYHIEHHICAGVPSPPHPENKLTAPE